MGRRRTLAGREKDYRALQLRHQGLSYEHIARELGWSSVSSSRQAIQRALADSVFEAADEVRQIESARLDDLMRVLLRIVMTKHYHVSTTGAIAYHPITGEPLVDDGPVMQAVAGILRISERRAKLLGLDAPAKHIITLDQLDQEIRALETELKRNETLHEYDKKPPPELTAG